MKFKKYLNETYIINESNISKYIKDIMKLKGNKLKSILKDSWKKFDKIITDNALEKPFAKIINREFGTNYKSFNDIKKIKGLNESQELNEDWKNFLKFWKSETYPALSIFPTLSIWFEIDKLVDGAGIKDLDWRKIAIYATLWIIIVSGQHLLLFKKWKKENPEEWEKEGKPGIFKSGK